LAEGSKRILVTHVTKPTVVENIMKAINLSRQALNLRKHIKEGIGHLGNVVVRDDIRSTMSPFRTLPDYRITYPNVVKQALFGLYTEYNQQFVLLMEQNSEWDTDYQHCRVDGQPINRWVQIDMVGLPDSFLSMAEQFSADQVREQLRHWIFEIENSLAMYQLLERVLPELPFQRTFRASLEELRQQYGKQIALLAVTEEKHRALCADEFGVTTGVPTNEVVNELSGFDRLFSPSEFRDHVHDNGGTSNYLLFVRSSDPLAKLKKPGMQVDHPLLGDPEMRRVIRANALTFNIDNPAENTPERRINDTKAYMEPIGLAHEVLTEDQVLSQGLQEHIRAGKRYADYPGQYLAPDLAEYLARCGVDVDAVAKGRERLRVKPLRGTYGCYGHLTVNLANQRDRTEFRQVLKRRGAYVVQPELPTPFVVDPQSGVTYGYIDRNFVTILGGEPVWMGGFRSMLPLVSIEAQKGRYHGNSDTHWAAIS
jgi:hypothetical protein